MPSTENDVICPLTINRHQKIWRYMDFAKFVDLITTKSLWFNRSDQFEDKFEGTYPLENLRIIRSSETDQMERVNRQLRQFTYINCWYVSNHESAAMWNLYSSTNEAVAIQSTYERLHSLMPKECLIGEVDYIDFNNDSIMENNTFVPFLKKRLAFSHENEIRAIIHDASAPNRDNEVGDSAHNFDAVNDVFGLSVAVDPLKLVQKIHVSPMSPPWYKDLVSRVCQSHGFSSDAIELSELEERPY